MWAGVPDALKVFQKLIHGFLAAGGSHRHLKGKDWEVGHDYTTAFMTSKLTVHRYRLF